MHQRATQDEILAVLTRLAEQKNVNDNRVTRVTPEDVARATGHPVSLMIDHSSAMPEPIAIELLRHIADDPGAWVNHPYSAGYAAWSGVQALDYACANPWLRLMLAMSCAKYIRCSADGSYGPYYDQLAGMCEQGRLEWRYRLDALRAYGGGNEYRESLAVACFLYEQRDVLVPLARASELIAGDLCEFLHAALGEWCAALVHREYHDRHVLLRRISADGRRLADLEDYEPYLADDWYDDCEPLRYDPSEVYGAGWSSVCGDSTWPAVKIVLSVDDDTAWACLELLVQMSAALAEDPSMSVDFENSRRFGAMMALAQTMSGRP